MDNDEKKPIVTVERVLQTLVLFLVAIQTTYLLVYTTNERERNDCQARVNEALIVSIQAGREAGRIENDAMDELVAGLLAPGANSRQLLQTYQAERTRADELRVDNPLPNPVCN
jgi:hypothetical protein